MSQKTQRGSSPTPDSSTQLNPSDAALTPSSTATSTPKKGSGGSSLDLEPVLSSSRKMDKEQTPDQGPDEGGAKEVEEAQDHKGGEGASNSDAAGKEDKPATKAEAEDPGSPKKDKKKGKKSKKSSKCQKHDVSTKKGAKSVKATIKTKTVVESDSDSSDSSDDESEDDSSSSDSSSSSSSEDERARKKRKSRAKQKAALKKKLKEKAKAKAKARKHKKSKKYDSSSDSSESESDSSSDESEVEASSADEQPVRRRASTKSKKGATVYEIPTEIEEAPVEDWSLEADTTARLVDQASRLIESVNTLSFSIQARQLQARSGRPRVRVAETTADPIVIPEPSTSRSRTRSKKVKKDKSGKVKKASTLDFKRVDQVWDSNIHAYKFQESAESQEDEFDQYIFTVRRRFNWENKYRDTVIDLKSKVLREALQELMKDVKSVSLVEEQPCLDPNTLFLYLEELRSFYKKTLKRRIKKTKKRKQKKHLELMRKQVKVMLNYLDEDYAETKKALYPLLEAGNITFEYIWALFKPNSLAYTTTYGAADEPRCFKVDYAYKDSSMLKGEWYSIEGRYMEYDGKQFGLGDFEAEIPSFKGPRKITNLPVYPLSFHKDPDQVRELLLERGKKFVTLQGMNYKFCKGLAFQKRKQGVAKVHINGRIMIDPAIFRRINPNYRISIIKAKDQEGWDSDSDDDGSCSDCDGGGGDDDGSGEKQKMVWRFVRDKDDNIHYVQVPVDEDGNMIKPEKLEPLPNVEAKNGADSVQHFEEEELLIASPVVYGFSFQEKLWLEFTLSSVQDIQWNDGAFDSLVIEPSQKSIVKALVSSHKFHAAETIDDVVQGKGKGLVFVLHGPPGVGKTLTGEGIAEMLRCPLYMVSAGELGTDYRTLELELQKIMDIAHSWGAVLLLDEADVFLEKRQIHDISRNALVSIFLRILEYFQGILFLTTNRVETFDEAFQSRIHVALRYEELGHKAKKEIWKMFLNKVASMEGAEAGGLSERELEVLARHNMNGRQIKNAVKTAQALAVNEGQKLSMGHIERVLRVAESFDRDLRGLTLDAMKSYI